MKYFVLAVAFVGGSLTTVNLHAGVWTCVEPNGVVFFDEAGGVGCHTVVALSGVQSSGFSGVQGAGLLRARSDSARPLPVSERAVSRVLSSRPFASVSQTVPALSYRDLSPGMRAKGWNIPNKGDIQLLQVDVSYAPSGDGPYLATDHHFLNGARQALGVAVMAAAKATRYDPRFLDVRLSIPMVAGSFHRGALVDGGSAGAVWAVAVVSAILGDEVRQDLCFSGTINMNLTIGPVGGLEDKIEGCHMLPQFQELMVPAGQRTFALTDKGMGRSIEVTEVSTLAEAYEVATGQFLRFAQ